MTVDIHPEDLLDKLAAEVLSAAEGERLRAHLRKCSVCRFELSVRQDLLTDMPEVGERPHTASNLLEPPARLPATRSSRAPATPRRWMFVAVAAALVLSAAGAAAVTGAAARVFSWGFRTPSNGVLQRALPARDARAAAPRFAQRLPPGLSPLVLAPRADAAEPSPSAELAIGSEAHRPDTARSRSPVADLTPLSEHSDLGATASSNGLATTSSAAIIDFSAAIAPATATATATDPGVQADNTPPVDAASVFSEANRERRDGNAEHAEALYRALQAHYSASPESVLSRALLAQLQLDRGNTASALTGFESYLATGSSALAAEASVGRAWSLERLGRVALATAAWREVESRFPDTVHARLAAKRLSVLDRP